VGSLGRRKDQLEAEVLGGPLAPPMRRLPGPIDVADGDYLSPCVRDYIRTQPEAARHALTAVYARYATRCEDGGVVLERPLGDTRGDRRARPALSLVGRLAVAHPDVALRVATCNGESAAPDHVTIVADGVTWTSSRLEFQRDGNACDVAELPLTHALARVLSDATAATDLAVRFEGHRVTRELVVGDPIKRELRIVLDAIDALSAP
jgi:hypothetical protein